MIYMSGVSEVQYCGRVVSGELVVMLHSSHTESMREECAGCVNPLIMEQLVPPEAMFGVFISIYKKVNDEKNILSYFGKDDQRQQKQ